MKTKYGFSAVTLIVLFLFSISFSFVSGTAEPANSCNASVVKNYGNLPLYFIENKGQFDSRVRFYARTASQKLYFTDNGIVFDLFRKKKNGNAMDPKRIEIRDRDRHIKLETERLVFTLGFKKPKGKIVLEGLDRQNAGINYFVGNDKNKWKTGIPTFKCVLYKEVYQGIDLKVYGKGSALEYEFIIHPGASPKDIVLTYDGIEGIRTNEEGELLISTAFGDLKETKPHIYQYIGGKKEVAGSFAVIASEPNSQPPKYSYGFQVASYDSSYPLIIDPTISYSTYLGGSDADRGYGIALDSSGNAYITGRTSSTDFPTTAPFQGNIDVNDSGYDAFITKVAASGSSLIYSTYLGGKGLDSGYSIAVDASGNAYIIGETYSTDFPTKNPYQGTKAGQYDVFITKLNASGDALTYSTYLGGGQSEWGYGIDVDASGNAYVTGETWSTDFPTKNPYQGTNAGQYDVFITKFNASGNDLIYSTYLGGSDDDRGNGISVDVSGNAYVTGYTGSTDFPTKNSYQGSNAGICDVFISKISSSGSSLTYSTYLGGKAWDHGDGVAVDASGNAYVTGYTESTDFPTKNAYQGSNAGGADAFVTKISVQGSSLTYSTYLGGSDGDYGEGISVNGSGNTYISGYSYSNDFPTKNAYQGINAGNADAFVTKLSSSGITLGYSTYLGGADYDLSLEMAIDTKGNAYITGYTESTNFPIENAYQITYAGSVDAFITKLDDVVPVIDGGYAVTSGIWAKAILQVAGNPVTLIWQEVGRDITPNGDHVISGYFYADPKDFAYGSHYNPEVFVKIYIATNGWCNIAFNHVTVDDVSVYSAHNYSGKPDQSGAASLINRLVEHQYTSVTIY